MASSGEVLASFGEVLASFGEALVQNLIGVTLVLCCFLFFCGWRDVGDFAKEGEKGNEKLLLKVRFQTGVQPATGMRR